MTLIFPTLAFAFDPIIIKVTNLSAPYYFLTFDMVTGKRVVIKREPRTNPYPTPQQEVAFEIGSIVQALFDKKRFFDVEKSDIILLKQFNFYVYDSVGVQPALGQPLPISGTINIIWGALQIGDKYTRTRTLTWYKNLPFTFPLYLQKERYVNVAIDGGASNQWDDLNAGKYNLLPAVTASKKAVYTVVVVPPKMQLDFDTTIANPTLSVALKNLTDKSVWVNWGDGTVTHFDPSMQIGSAPWNFNHTYAAGGHYTATVWNIINVPAHFVETMNTFVALRADEGIKTIGDNAFYSNINTMNVSMPTTLESIGANAFYNCQKFDANFVFNHLTYLGVNAFTYTKVQSVVFNEGCTIDTIPQGCFTGVGNLKSVHLSSSIMNIGVDAFSGCTTLASMNLPSNLISLGLGGFNQLYALPGDLVFTNLKIATALNHPISPGNLFVRMGITSLKVLKFNNPTPIIFGTLVYECANLLTVQIGDANAGSSVDIAGFTYQNFTNCTKMTDFWYYGNTLPTLTVGTTNLNFNPPNANLKIHMKAATMALYNPTTYPEWAALWQYVVAI